MSTGVGTWTNWSTFEPDPIIVRMPESENLKVEDLSKSVKQAHHSEQATGHGVHCREILFTPRCSPRASDIESDFTVTWHLLCRMEKKYNCGKLHFTTK